MKRKAGILMPVFSLPGKYGIGCFSKEAYRFADFLKASGQSYWQILPLGPTGFGDSPYQSFSTFAGNPYYISLEDLVCRGLLKDEECDEMDFGADPGTVDYGKLFQGRWMLLRRAFLRSNHSTEEAYLTFLQENDFWLEDYALFMAIKDAHQGAPLSAWERSLALREPEALARCRDTLAGDVAFYKFLQYVFYRQWNALRKYVNDLGIRIVGDIPIYVSADSADFWAHRELFLLDEGGEIAMVAGVPPDGFSAEGQLWGNPLYDWAYHKETGFDWWIRRIGQCRALYDVIRIDHFRGFDEFFAVPAADKNAAGGHWEKGPGMALFRALRSALGELAIIAEDLGYVTDSVRQLVADTGFPNMKVLEFAFDSRDSSGAAEYLPYRYRSNCVVYTGTHDNETVRGWIDSILPQERAKVIAYLGLREDDPQQIVEQMVRLALSSVADLCIIPLQDYLGLDNTARINHPSTFGSNWKWRFDSGVFDEDLSRRLRELALLYGRLEEA